MFAFPRRLYLIKYRNSSVSNGWISVKFLKNNFSFPLSLGYSKTNALNHKKAGIVAELPPAPMPYDEKNIFDC